MDGRQERQQRALGESDLIEKVIIEGTAPWFAVLVEVVMEPVNRGNVEQR
jgi:hypothetical protein